jgi:nucleoside 2-deoxyribosyltransferase
MSIYLSGPIDFSSEESLSRCTEWRVLAAKQLSPIESIDPMRGGAHLAPNQTFSDMDNGKALVVRDMVDIAKCDLMLVHFPESVSKRGIGTLMEMMLCSTQGKPIILVDPDEKVSNHPWVKYAVTETFDSIEMAIERIQNYWARG